MISGQSEIKDIINDQYLLSSLLSYQQHKIQIVINLHYLYLYKSNVKSELLDIVFHRGVKQNSNEDVVDNDLCNLTQTQIFIVII